MWAQDILFILIISLEHYLNQKKKKMSALLIYHRNIIFLNEKILVEPKEILLE